MSPNLYRAGPWPGLTPRGAMVVLGCAALLGLTLSLIEPAAEPWPDLVKLGAASLIPLALATRITGMPGAASAACGAYLLPRTLASVLVPGLDPPPLLLIPAIAFDLCLWLRAAHLTALADVWPKRRQRWRRRRTPAKDISHSLFPQTSAARTLSPVSPRSSGVGGAVGWRLATSGALYAVALAAIVPPWSVLFGGDPAVWSGDRYLAASAATVAVDASIALVVLGPGRLTHGRRTES